MNNNLGQSINQMVGETTPINDVLSAIGYDESAIKTSADAEKYWDKLFQHWNTTYPDNQKWNAAKVNPLWANGYQQAYDTIDKIFHKYATREWNKAHPEHYFNKETQKYQLRPTENLKWNEELGEWE